MDANDLSTFKEAAKRRTIPSVETRIAEGESGWLRGQPIAAKKDLISIQTRNGTVITLAESAVVEYVQSEDEFFIRVKRGTNTVVRLETTLSLDPRRPEKSCDCDKTGEPTASFKSGQNSNVGPIADTGPVIQCPYLVCGFEWVEKLCLVPGKGEVVKCYALELMCTDLCDGGII